MGGKVEDDPTVGDVFHFHFEESELLTEFVYL
jgi:hypothetical protein